MKFNFTKIVLPAAVLTAGVLATYAVDEVTLGNGTAISWETFVEAVSNPSALKGKIADLPDTNSAKQAYDLAFSNQSAKSGAVTTAQEEYNTASGEKDDADAEVTSAQTAVTTAQTDLDNANAAVTTAEGDITKAQADLEAANEAYIADAQKTSQEALDKANADLKQYQETDLPKLQNTLAGYNQSKETLESQISSKEDSRTLQENALAALPKKKGTVEWLAEIVSNAADWNNEYKSETPNTSKTLPTLYVKIVTTQDIFGDDVSNLNLSFIKPDGYTDATTNGGWTPCTTLLEFTTAIKDINSTLANVDNVYVDMGADYANLNSNNKLLTITKPSKKGAIITNSYDKIVSLEDLSKYQGDTGEYDNQAAAINYQNTIRNLTNDINALSIRLYGAHPNSEGKLPFGATEESNGVVDQINATQESIDDLQDDIDKLNGEADVKGSIKYYEEQVEAAKTTAENEVKAGTATSAAITAANNALSTAQTAKTTAEGNVGTYTTALNNAKTNLETKQGLAKTAAATLAAKETALNDAKADLRQANSDLNTATANAQAAANTYAFEPYNTITLNSDIVASTTTGANYAGTIMGNGKTITVPTGALFNDFSGKLSKAAVNGTFATIYNNGSFTDVAVWTGSTGRYYGDTGVPQTNLPFDELGYAARDYFGANLVAKKLVNEADNYKVYKLTVNQQDNNNITKYVNVSAGKMNDNKGAYSLPVNTFAQSADDDIAGSEVANVYYGSNNDCDKVIVTDGQNFMCPVDIVTSNVEYTREFKAGYNAACLPFALDYAANKDNILSICTYDQEDADRFWFTKNDGPIAAYTPVLIVGKSGAGKFTLNMSDLETPVTIAKTNTSNPYYVGAGTTEEGISYGTYKATNYEQFEGAKDGYKIYGLQAGQFVYAGANTPDFPAFRMVISSSFVKTPEQASNMPRRIGIRNANGVDITDETSGIESANADAASFSVVGGQGEIKITSEADYGDVAIYSLDGKMIKVANVMAGTTSVNLQQGVYIVLGKKVMVK